MRTFYLEMMVVADDDATEEEAINAVAAALGPDAKGPRNTRALFASRVAQVQVRRHRLLGYRNDALSKKEKTDG